MKQHPAYATAALADGRWFKYRDNDPDAKGADPSNFDSNRGIADLDLKPFAPLMDSMGDLNRQVYSLAEYFDKRKP